MAAQAWRIKGVWLLLALMYGSLQASTQVLVAPNDPNIQYMGRVDFSNRLKPRWGWSGVSIKAIFGGSSIGILLQDGHNDYDAFVDGKLQSHIVTDAASRYDLAGLGMGTHTLLLSQRTEGMAGIATFNGLILEAGQLLSPPSAMVGPKFEILGDSLSAGYGVESPGLTCSSLQLRQYINNYPSYDAVAARHFHADYHVVAVSGHGLVHNYGDSSVVSTMPMPFYYDRALFSDPSTKWDFNLWQPDAVIIFLGTNDFAKMVASGAGPMPSQGQYEGAYKRLISTIRSNYRVSKPWIFCLSKTSNVPMHDYVRNVVDYEHSAMRDSKVVLVSLRDPDFKDLGCDWHPNVRGQALWADDLIAAITSATGWK